MNRFGKRDRNDFFGDAYEKAKPVSLNTGKEKNYLGEPEKVKIETSKVRPSAEKTTPVNQDRSRERYSLDEPIKDAAEPRRQPITERVAPVNQDRSREGYTSDVRVKDAAEPRKQPITERTVPVNQDRSREGYTLDERVKDAAEPRRQPITEKVSPVNQDRSRERYSLDKSAKDTIEPRKQPVEEKTIPESQDKRRSRERDEQDDLFIPRRRDSSSEQTPKTYSGGNSPQRPKELKPTVSAAPKGYDRSPARGGSGGGGQSKKGKTTKRRMPIAAAILIDVLVAALLMGVFYVTNFGKSKDIQGEALSTPTKVVSASPSPTKSVSATPTPSAPPSTQASTPPSTPPSTQPSATPAASIDPNNWRAKFADKFSSDGKVHQQSADGKWTYQSANVSINTEKHTDNGVVYFVNDIYVADIKYFKTAFGVNPDKFGQTQFVQDAMKNVNGIVGINGDMCLDNHCLIIRNGQFFNKWPSSLSDELVMYNDGTMKAFAAKQFSFDDIKAQAPYQAWGFGPSLLDDNGQPKTSGFVSTENISGANNPRTAIGYYEPGHYCFVVVDGRQPGYSDPGFSFVQMSQLMNKLGCKVAFNLDGGGTSQLAFNGARINQPAPNTYRKCSDFIYITDDGYTTPKS